MQETPQQLLKAVPKDVKQVVQSWRSIIRDLPGAVQGYLKSARLGLSSEGALLISLDDMAGSYMSRESHRQELVDMIAKKMGKAIEVEIQTQEQGEAGSATGQGLDLQKIINMEIMVEEDGEL